MCVKTGDIRHPNENMIAVGALEPHIAAPALDRDVRREVNIIGANNVGVLQLAHEQHLICS